MGRRRIVRWERWGRVALTTKSSLGVCLMSPISVFLAVTPGYSMIKARSGTLNPSRWCLWGSRLDLKPTVFGIRQLVPSWLVRMYNLTKASSPTNHEQIQLCQSPLHLSPPPPNSPSPVIRTTLWSPGSMRTNQHTDKHCPLLLLPLLLRPP